LCWKLNFFLTINQPLLSALNSVKHELHFSGTTNYFMKRPIILVVVDDPIDRRAIRKRLVKELGEAVFWEAKDGKEALQFISGSEASGSNPFLVLLDLNMPVMDGLSFLKNLRSDKSTAHTLVFVFTSSSNPVDVQQAFSHNVAGYFQKESSDEKLGDFIQVMESYYHSCQFVEHG